MLSLAEQIVAEMKVRYAEEGLKVSDVVDLSEDDGDEDLSDEEGEAKEVMGL